MESKSVASRSFLIAGLTGTRPEVLLSVVAIVAFAAFVVHVLYQRLWSPLAKIPGPFLASISSLWWPIRVRIKRNQAWDAIELHKKYGSVVKIGPNEVLVADPDAFKVIYAAGSGFHKSVFYKPLHGNSTWNITTVRDEKLHAFQRRLVAKAYSLESLKTLEKCVDTTIASFIKRMQGQCDRAMDFGHWLQLFAIDAVGEVTFSQPYGYLEQGHDDGFFETTKKFLRCAPWIGFVPWLYDLHNLTKPVIGPWLGIVVRDSNFHEIATRQTREHQARTNNHLDILGYLEMVRKEKPDQFSESDMINMVTSNVFAGSDTTAISLRAIFYHLLKNVEYLTKLREELAEREADGLLSDPISYEQVHSWPLLQAVMHEALRLHAPFAIHLPRVVPSSGLAVDGHFLPAGTHVGTNAWVIHRDAEVFGDDADQFRPERWLDPEKKTQMRMPPSNLKQALHAMLTNSEDRFFFAFGGGSRTCLGRNVVWLEMSKLIPTLLREFDIELADPTKPMNVEYLCSCPVPKPERTSN